MDATYFTLNINNTFTGATDEVEVSKEIFDAYRRLGYNAGYRERKTRKNETVFSGLVGSHDYSFDNFHEFGLKDEDPQYILAVNETTEELKHAIGNLTQSEIKLLRGFFTGESDSRCASECDLPYMTYRRRKQRTLNKLRNILVREQRMQIS